jgi:peptidoglycan/LPS O-acetylase OafA/YrhL
LLREQTTTGRIQYVRFISRRLKRLLPTLLLVLLSVSLVALVVLSEYEARIQSGSFAYAVTWTSNFFFVLSNFDYFSPLQARDLYLHTWSLGVEEQFYLVWPILILSAHGLLLRNGKPANTRRRMGLILAGVALLSLALSLYWSRTNALLAFYSMPTRAWQFALGAFVTLILRDYPRSAVASEYRAGPVPNSVIAWLGMVLVVGSAMILHRQFNYPDYYALFPSIGAALLIAAANRPDATGIHKVLTNRYVVWVGDRSYSIYLWHWPLLVLTAQVSPGNDALRIAGLITASILLATFSYRWVEVPFWKGKLSAAIPSRAVLVSILAVLVTIASVQGARRVYYDDDIARGFAIAYDPRADMPSIYGQGCDTWYSDANVIPCSNGDRETVSTAVLIGDSIGVQWHPALTEIFDAPQWRLITFTKSACPIVDEDFFYEVIKRTYSECSEWRSAVIDHLTSIDPDLILIGNSATYEFSEQQWIDGSRRVLDRLTQIASQVVIIPGSPALSFNGPTCLLESADHDSCEEALASSLHDDVAKHLRTAALDFENANVMDLNDLVCPDRRCAALGNDAIVVFRDEQHVTSRFARTLIPVIRSRLAEFETDSVLR